MHINDSINKKISEFARFAEQMPGVVIVHHIVDFSVAYMTSNGLKLLGVTLQDLIDMKTDYYRRFFNMDDLEDFMPQMRVLLENNKSDEAFSFFQQVKYAGKDDWTWHISSVRIFMWDDAGNPLLTITMAYPINRMKHIEAKAERLLQENNFLKKNIKAFSTLSKREKDILRLVALGQTSVEIAKTLFISVETAQTHRRNIRNKLGITNVIDFASYARAFDLI